MADRLITPPGFYPPAQPTTRTMKALIILAQTIACAALGWGFVQAAILLHNFVHSY